MNFKNKKQLNVFIILGVVISLILLSLSSVSLTTTPEKKLNLAPVIVKQGAVETLIYADRNNFFTLSLPISTLKPINYIESSQLVNSKVNITNIIVTNAFGGTISLNFLKIKSVTVEILKLSKFINLTVGNSYPARPSWLPLYLIVISFVTSLLLVLSHWLIYNTLIQLLYFYKHYVEKMFCHLPKNLILIISTLLVIIFSLWATFSGIVYSDDGYFGLMAKYPDDVKIANSTFYLFTHLLWKLANENLIVFRIMAWSMSLLSGCIIYLATLQLLNLLRINIDKRGYYVYFVLTFITSFFIVYYQVGVDYNILSHLIVYLQLAILISLYANFELLSRTKLCAMVFALGAISGANLFIKFPTFFASTLFVIILLFFIFRIKNLLFVFITFIGGITIIVGSYFMLFQSYSEFHKLYANTFQYMALSGSHRISDILRGNILDVLSVLFQSLLIILVYRHLVNKLALKYTRETILRYLISLIAMIMLICGLANNGIMEYFVCISKFVIYIIMLVGYENLTSLTSKTKLQRIAYKRINIISFILLVFIYISSVGTDTPILYHVIFEASLLIIVLILQWQFMIGSQQTQFYELIICVICFFFIKGIIFSSIRYGNLLQQTIPYHSNKSVVLIDKPTNEALNLLKNSLTVCGYKDGDYIAGFYFMPGIVYALNARSPVTPWIAHAWSNNDTIKANEFIFSLMSENMVKHTVVMQDLDSLYPQLLGSWSEHFESCTIVDLPDFFTWQKVKHVQLYRYK